MSAEVPGAPQPEAEWREPLLLKVRHLTRFIYQGPTQDSFNEARLRPVTDHGQECREFALHIEPGAIVRDYPDFFANCVHYFDVAPRHESLRVEAVSVVQTRPDDRGPVPAVNLLSSLKNPEIVESWFEFLQDSAFVSLEAEIWREAHDVVPAGASDLWEDALAIGTHIFRHFRYTPKFTTVNTHPVEVLRERKGVCQDFAHVMLGMCRSLGIPARYVSGYFYNPERLPDEIEASHAWVEVFLPGYGWKGFDPTHNRIPDTRYVKIATGRDYGDIRPLSGTFRGKGTREMVVEVQVTRLDLAGAGSL
jgi:transglutaminase-like putative cysteine protease